MSVIRGSLQAVKIKVIGSMPQTLKFTQVVSGCVLQTIHLKLLKK
jgi:hypothetical protein